MGIIEGMMSGFLQATSPGVLVDLIGQDPGEFVDAASQDRELADERVHRVAGIRLLCRRHDVPCAHPDRAHEWDDIRLLGESPGTDGSVFDLHVAWPFTVHRATLVLRSRGDLGAISVNGEPLASSAGDDEKAAEEGDPRIVRYYAPPLGGFTLRVEVAGGQPLELEAVGQRYGLPVLAGFSYRPRPDDRMPRWGWNSDSTFVRSAKTVAPGNLTAASAEAPAEERR